MEIAEIMEVVLRLFHFDDCDTGSATIPKDDYNWDINCITHWKTSKLDRLEPEKNLRHTPAA